MLTTQIDFHKQIHDKFLNLIQNDFNQIYNES